MTSSNGNIFRVTGPLCVEFTGHRWIPITKASDAELWCFLWSVHGLNGRVNNREAGDLRHHHTHYDVTVMLLIEKHFSIQYLFQACGSDLLSNSFSKKIVIVLLSYRLPKQTHWLLWNTLLSMQYKHKCVAIDVTKVFLVNGIFGNYWYFLYSILVINLNLLICPIWSPLY